MARRRSINAVEGFHHGKTPIPVATIVNNMLFSGAISGYDHDIGDFVDGMENQVQLVFTYVRRVLDAAATSPDNVGKMTFYVKSKEVRQAINKEWLDLFPDPDSRPARHTMTHEMPANKFLMCDLIAVIDNE